MFRATYTQNLSFKIDAILWQFPDEPSMLMLEMNFISLIDYEFASHEYHLVQNYSQE